MTSISLVRKYLVNIQTNYGMRDKERISAGKYLSRTVAVLFAAEAEGTVPPCFMWTN